MLERAALRVVPSTKVADVGHAMAEDVTTEPLAPVAEFSTSDIAKLAKGYDARNVVPSM